MSDDIDTLFSAINAGQPSHDELIADGRCSVAAAKRIGKTKKNGEQARLSPCRQSWHWRGIGVGKSGEQFRFIRW